MSRLKSSSNIISGESDLSFNSLPVDSTAFESGEMFPVFLQKSSSKWSDLNVSETICNEIKEFRKLNANIKDSKRGKNLYII